jgi:hypothetical protein
MKVLFNLFSLLLIQNTFTFTISESTRQLQQRMPKTINTKIEEVRVKEFAVDKFCGGYDSIGLCSICYNSYLDFSTKRCVPVENQILNCLSYDQNNLCMVCEFGFRIEGKGEACRPNDDPNCLVENSKECEVRLF